MPILNDQVARYIEQLRPARDPLMTEMEELAARDGIPIVHWETGRFLAAQVRTFGPKVRVLEVGTAIGYSTLHMARALGKDGEIVTLERDPVRVEQAVGFLERDGVGDRVRVAEGDALETIEQLHGKFDLLFLDATKGEYGEYLRRAERLLNDCAAVVVDNVLMSGSVALPDDAEVPDEFGSWWTVENRQAARRLNNNLIESDCWTAVVVPLGDGILFATR